MFEYAVVGSGVGGSSIAAYLNAKGEDVILFEKESYLGGCSSTFMHRGYKYNTGATTLSGYQDGLVVKEVFDSIGFKPKLIETDPTIVIKQNKKTTPRYKNLEKFINVVSKNYPNSKNREFWSLIHKINTDFYRYRTFYYCDENFLKKVKSLLSFTPMALAFQKYIRGNAYDFIEDFFEGISKEYMQFLESQIFIVAQASSREINFLTAALSLGYTFGENHYVIGGFSQLFDDLTQEMEYVKRGTEVLNIKKYENHFEVDTSDGSYKARKLILNATVYDSAKLFDNKNIKNYYKKYEKLNNYQSSFMVYITLKSKQKFEHHYQIIKDERLEHTLSHAIFVSFSDESDTLIAPQGYYSITASVHTDSRFWEDKKNYQIQKKKLHAILLDTIVEELDIDINEIVQSFAATPKSFQHYINRTQLGGNAMTMKNLLPFLPSNDSKVQNLYNVGDTVFAAQGWPGVMLGVRNLTRLLDV